MKTIRIGILASAAVFASLFFAACGELLGTADNHLEASFDGEVKEWKGLTVTALEVDSINGVLIQAIKTETLSSAEQLNLGLADFDGAGTYTIDLESSNLATYSITGTEDNLTSISSAGEIKVSSFEDNILKGTFHLNLVTMDQATIRVTDGSFVVKLVN